MPNRGQIFKKREICRRHGEHIYSACFSKSVSKFHGNIEQCCRRNELKYSQQVKVYLRGQHPNEMKGRTKLLVGHHALNNIVSLSSPGVSNIES
jgi:CRISPR/Cas system CMR subunit Cmr6 (Cas7 group RAMP superfamily)